MNNKPLSEIDTSLEAATAADGQGVVCLEEPISIRRRLKRRVWHILVRQITLWPLAAIRIADWIGRRQRPIGPEGCEIMLTGRFDSANWILAHLGPLAASSRCSRLWMVSTNLVPELPKVTPVYPARWLMSILGTTPARLLTFGWAAIRKRPHVVGGFYLIANGMVAAVTGRLAGAKSMYFCVGGPAEIAEGGVHSKDNISGNMETPDAVVEGRLLRIARHFDVIVTMGTKAAGFLRNRGVETEFHVVPGGIDSERFRPAEEIPPIDLILTGRLAPIKRMDVFLKAVRQVAERRPGVKAVIVGDGELRGELQQMAIDLGIEDNVSFAGRQDNVHEWLRRAKVFVLTSDSEGLSLSMMEAMMSGLPAVVSDVGDLVDLVENGVNGYLVPRRSPELFADRLVELLSDEEKLAAFSRAARRSALRYETKATIQRWDRILADF
jgi:L-malate glycosyltransferase